MADITIPREAEEAGKDSAFNWLRGFMEHDVRVQEMTDEELGELVSAACIAMLRAWPGSEYVYRQPHRRAVSYSKPAIILPLPQEKQNG